VDGRIVTEGPGVPKDGDIYALPYDGVRLDDALSSRGVLALGPAGGGRAAVTTVLELSQLALEGDAAARETWAAFGVRLAEALRPTLQAFKPEVLVLGGKISGSFALFAEAAQAGLRGLEPPPDLLPARDIGGAALRGAARVVFEREGV
jgi:glucokinase